MKKRWSQWQEWGTWQDRVVDADQAFGVMAIDIDDLVAGATEFAQTIVDATVEPLRAIVGDVAKSKRFDGWFESAKRWSDARDQ